LTKRSTTPDEDLDVIRRVGSGDRAAFRVLVERYQGPLYAFVLRMVRRPAIAEEIVQEAFVRAFAAAPRFRPTATVGTWLFSIAARLALNEAAKAYHREEIAGEAPDIAGAGDSPLERLEHKELARTLERALALLPPQQRAAVVLARFEDMPYRQIGQVLEVSEGAVDGLLQRARQTLARLLRAAGSGGHAD
jgi:RNA polymerase sigma-70 factor (ECF subfamily)